MRFLFCSAGSSRSPEFLRCPRNFLWYGGPVQLVTLPGLSLWFFRTWLGFSGAPPDIRRAFFLFLNALFVLASASSRRFGYSMLCLSVTLFPGAEVGGPLLSSRALWRRLRPLPCSSVCGLHCTGPTNGRLLYPVRSVRCSWSAWAAHRQRCEPFMLPQVIA